MPCIQVMGQRNISEMRTENFTRADDNAVLVISGMTLGLMSSFLIAWLVWCYWQWRKRSDDKAMTVSNPNRSTNSVSPIRVTTTGIVRPNDVVANDGNLSSSDAPVVGRGNNQPMELRPRYSEVVKTNH